MGLLIFIFAFVIVNVARYFMIKIISSLVNYFRIHSAISDEFKFVMWVSGFRGAMCKIFSYVQLTPPSLRTGNPMHVYLRKKSYRRPDTHPNAALRLL